jgi:hypothetical protein
MLTKYELVILVVACLISEGFIRRQKEQIQEKERLSQWSEQTTYHRRVLL